jgi:RES domain-containing protein
VSLELSSGGQNESDATREVGTKWLRGNSALLLKVPSAIIPETFNFLFNPLHPDAKTFRIADTFTYPFDSRLKK